MFHFWWPEQTLLHQFCCLYCTSLFGSLLLVYGSRGFQSLTCSGHISKVYVKSCDPDCKILHTLVSFNGIVVLSVGFVSEHKALDFKPILDVKMKIWSAENEDENFSIFQEIEFPL